MTTKKGVLALSGMVAVGIISLALVGSAFAQGVTTSSSVNVSSSVASASMVPTADCSSVAPGLYRGVANARVSALQRILASLGFFNGSATGFFGPITYGALVSFQNANGIPATGYFGSMSFAALSKHCGNPSPNPTPTPSNVSFTADPTSGAAPLPVSFSGTGVTGGSQYIIDFGDGSHSDPLAAIDVCMHLSDGSGGCPRVQTSHTYSSNGTYTATLQPYIACMWSNPRCMIATVPLGSVTITVGGSTAGVTPKILGLDPTSGSIGRQVTITGNNFTNDNTIHFGSGVIMHVPISSTTNIQCFAAPCYPIQTLTFAVPASMDPACLFTTPACKIMSRQTTPGTYQVSVENSGGTSNQTPFVVTDSGGSGTLSVTGIDAPTMLAMGVSGTWTVHVRSSSTNPTLHYSVVWGDENQVSGNAVMMPAPTSVQSSATFTHVYHTAGTYSPVFTVTDDAGNSTTASASVTITPWNY